MATKLFTTITEYQPQKKQEKNSLLYRTLTALFIFFCCVAAPEVFAVPELSPSFRAFSSGTCLPF